MFIGQDVAPLQHLIIQCHLGPVVEVHSIEYLYHLVIEGFTSLPRVSVGGGGGGGGGGGSGGSGGGAERRVSSKASLVCLATRWQDCV